MTTNTNDATPTPDNDNDNTVPVNVVAHLSSIQCWDNRLKLQSLWSNADKGWQVPVEWRPTRHGIGLFCLQDITVGTVLRRGIFGRNLLQFQNVADLERFGDSDAKLRYLADYLWGCYLDGVDDAGMPLSRDDDLTAPPPPPRVVYAMWLPGNGLNHGITANVVYRPSSLGIDLVALRPIRTNMELLDDYRRHGPAPPWILEFYDTHQSVMRSMNFVNCNDFV